MRRERRKKLTPAELKAAGVSREVVVRKIRRPDKAVTPGPGGLAAADGNSGAGRHNTIERSSSSSGGVGSFDRGDGASDNEKKRRDH